MLSVIPLAALCLEMTDFGGKTGRKDKGLYERGGLAHPVLRFLVKKRQQEVKGMELGKGWHRSADGVSERRLRR